MQSLDERTQGQSNFLIQKAAPWQLDAARQQTGPAFLRKHWRKKREQEPMKGKCLGFAWLQPGMPITKTIYNNENNERS